MATDLSGTSVLVIATNYGVEQDEIVVPITALTDAGATVTVAAVEAGDIQTLVGDRDPGQTVQADMTLDAVDPAAFAALVIPGGTINADTLRLQETAVDLANAFATAGKPIAAICHGPWLLVEGNLVRNKTLTSYASLQTDIENAGGSWVDAEVQVDETEGFTLITSRTPKDLDAFTGALTAVLAPAAV
jgi:protease I